MNGDALVTGLGVTAPNGIGVEAYWSATLAGKSGVDWISRFEADRYPTRVAGEVRDFIASDYVPGRLIPETDRGTHLGLVAADMALRDAGVQLSELPEYDLGVVTASSSGGTEFGQREIQNLWARGPRWVGPYQSIAWFYAATTGQISIRNGLRGPCGVICTEQAGGLDALAQARRLERSGARLVLAGGSDASLCPYGLVAQHTSGLLSRCDDPLRSYTPFDVGASGYVPGEGGAMLVVEAAASARARLAPHVYGVVTGYAATFDPRPGSGREPGLRRAVELALAEARVSPDRVDVVFADAAGVPELDQREAAAICATFGPFGVPVTAPKTMTGRMYAGGACLDVVTALLAIRYGVIPPTVGVDRLAPGCDLDLVRDEPRQTPVRTALVLARGFGGFNSALVVASPPN